MARVVEVAGDYMAEDLDARGGAQVTDQSIFRAHAAKYEVRGQGEQSRGGEHAVLRMIMNVYTAIKYYYGTNAILPEL